MRGIIHQCGGLSEHQTFFSRAAIKLPFAVHSWARSSARRMLQQQWTSNETSGLDTPYLATVVGGVQNAQTEAGLIGSALLVIGRCL